MKLKKVLAPRRLVVRITSVRFLYKSKIQETETTEIIIGRFHPEIWTDLWAMIACLHMRTMHVSFFINELRSQQFVIIMS
jgi:hypothetical protein